MNTESFPTLYLVVGSFFDPKSRQIELGGTETYSAALAQLAYRNGSQTWILQRSLENIRESLPGGITVESWDDVSVLRKRLKALRARNPGIVLQYEYTFIPEASELPCVMVQHGVGSDGTADSPNRPGVFLWLADVRRRLLWLKTTLREHRWCAAFSRVLCVDTNFINQMRANHPMYDLGQHLEYIPNFAAISEQTTIEKKWQMPDFDSGVVLFARRFVIQRGVYLWADCVEELAPRFPKVEFRFVGFGDGESRLKPLVQKHSNVSFYSRHHHEIQREHEAAHIEVVPSLWSEGTSLSCLEAMAAGCAIVCSDVGGLGNLVMPGYNGLILPPQTQCFTKAVADLLINPQKTSEMGRRAHQVAKTSFSRAAWESRVDALLEDVWRHPKSTSLARRWSS